MFLSCFFLKLQAITVRLSFLQLKLKPKNVLLRKVLIDLQKNNELEDEKNE